jgi:uncharacterized protein (TIGR04255 family)
MAKKAVVRHRLPKAPLVEVVFELRWRLKGSPGIPPQLYSDPGLLVLAHNFSQRAGKLGFGERQALAPPEQVGAYGVLYRYRKKDAPEFPLLQIGPGIFAANHGPQYEWQEFRSLVLDGLRALLRSYPRLPGYPLEPIHLELRYLDIFDRSLLDTPDIVAFINRGTTMRIDVPAFLQDRGRFVDDFHARLSFSRSAEAWKNAKFSIDLGTVLGKDQNAFRLETKVTTDGGGLPNLGTHTKYVGNIAEWLDFARGLTSPFFKDFIDKNLMAQFEAD